ncbi:MAG: response regulator transcription factor [Proteobacteria bacterium]|nr:response regulator transcription factor [Pseudomonadota bacterium]
MRILLVEDDRMIGAAVERALKDAAYAVDWVTDGATAVDSAQDERYELVLLDLGLPRCGGLDVLRRIRSFAKPVPVIIITARDDIDDRVTGLDLGADDYIVKPFDVRELTARMRVILRRLDAGARPILSNGTLHLDPATYEAGNGATLCRLTAREFALLQALMARPGMILSRQDLERQIYGWNEEVESNAVEFLIHSIRKKLGSTSIRNIRGIGWMVDRAA